MSTTVSELIEQHGGVMTPELAAQILDLADGETGEQPDSVESPDHTEEQEEATETAQAEPNLDDLNADNTVILARDGKHTISFDELTKARETARMAREEAETAKAEIARLLQEAQDRKDSGQQATQQDAQVALAQQAIDQGVNPEIFGDFSEGELAKGIDQLTTTKVNQAVKAALAEYDAQRKSQDTAMTAEGLHYKAIYDAHEDADSIADSQEFARWRDGLSSFERAGVDLNMQNGSAKEIIDVFDAFKKATGSAQSGVNKADVHAAAEKALANAKAPIPNSLSDFPGGSHKGITAEDRAAQMENGVDLISIMETWTQEQRDDFLNRQI